MRTNTKFGIKIFEIKSDLCAVYKNSECCGEAVPANMAHLGNHQCVVSISALDKLLGQLGTYATWLSSIAYLQKQLRIFIFFTPRFFFCDFTFSYCMKPSGMCLHIYSLPSSAFLKYQTRGFYCSWSKVDIRAWSLCKASLSSLSLCFSAKYLTGHRYFHKSGVYCLLASKNKINTRLAFVY